MTIEIKSIVAAFALAAVVAMPCFGQELQQRGLTGIGRDAFIGGALRTCNAKQLTDPVNVGISKTTLLAFCNCHASAAADQIPDNDGRDLADLFTDPKMLSKMRAVGADCRSQVIGKSSW